jgi:hypothetical protein
MTEVGRVRSQVVLSAVAGILVLAITSLGYRSGVDVYDGDRALLAITLAAAYVLGISMALRPNWRSRFGKGDRAVSSPHGGKGPLPGPPRRGHHPDCGAFEGHTVEWSGRTRCAGCTGLTVGAIAAILLTLVYVVDPPSVLWTSGPGLVIAGIALVTLDLFAALAGGLDPRAGMGLNALMMVGFALVSAGLLESTGELTWGLVGVIVSTLWMDTRIQVSRWNHAAVCAVCPEACVAYSI